MALTPEDLKAIQKVVDKSLEDIKSDIKEMKSDVKLLAKLNQLDDIRKNGRLMALYKEDKEEAWLSDEETCHQVRKEISRKRERYLRGYYQSRCQKKPTEKNEKVMVYF